jgi:hypothetical protein
MGHEEDSQTQAEAGSLHVSFRPGRYGDVREFLEKYDPFRLSNSRIRELYGSLVWFLDVCNG